jgi:ATP-binding cassette subfamily B protein RaxB
MSVTIQSEAAECGLACVAIIAAAHGKHVALAELRQRFPLSLRGARLNQVIEVAQALQLQSRPLRVELDGLRHLALPCILHWDLNHFVVLERADGKGIVIQDPAVGERSLGWVEASRHFTGVAVELAPMAGFELRAAPPAVELRQLTGPVRGLGRAVAEILIASLVLQFFVMLAPFYLQLVVDQVLVSAEWDLLVVLGLGFGLLLLVQIAVGLLRGWSVIHLSSRIGVQWITNVFTHLLRLPLDFFEKRHLGDINSRVGSVQVIQKTLTTSFAEAVIDGLMAVVTLGLMVAYSWKLALVTVAASIIYLGIRLVGSLRMRQQIERQLVAGARQQSFLLESLRGMQSLKLGGLEAIRGAAFRNLTVDVANQDIRLSRLSLAFASSSQLVFGAERIAVVWIGAALALGNVFSVGMLIAYLAYKEQFSTRIASLIDKAIEFRMLRVHGERLADIVLAAPDPAALSANECVPEGTRIVVSNVSFRYSDGEPWVLRHCSLVIEPGESVAITGGSGCGKTTLVKLMLGLLRPQEGSITIGGLDMHGPSARGIRARVGAVMQEDQLFAGNLADNISQFDPDVDMAQVEAAARLAAIHEEIAAMPMGYHSLIGDMGSALSGGQRQRVILARAFYRRPALLFLDEATSHLDLARERSVNEAVHCLDLTRVIVAHRPETIASADRVLVIDGGAIPAGARTAPASVAAPAAVPA